MGLLMLQSFSLAVKVCVFACFLVLQESTVFSISASSSVVPALSPIGFRSSSPTSASQPDGTNLHPPHVSPPLKPAQGPTTSSNAAPSLPPNAPTSIPPRNSIPPQVTSAEISPALPPNKPHKSPRHPEHHIKGEEAPVMNAPALRNPPQNAPPNQLVTPVVPPSILPELVAPSPSNLPVQPTLPNEPPSSSPGEHHVSPLSTPPPQISPTAVGIRVAAPINGKSNWHSHVNPSPTNAPSTHIGMKNLNRASAPSPYPKSTPNTGFHSPASLPLTTIQNHHHLRNNISAPTPLLIAVPPRASSKQAQDRQKSNLKTNFGHHAFPPLKSERHKFPAPSPTPPGQNKIPLLSPKTSTPRSLPQYPKKPFPALPPPPPNADCASLTCSEPLTNSPTGPLCICVLPVQVGLRLSVAVYTFFPLVSELAAEISAGVFMKQSQVRIMGANEASQDPEKTIVLIDLVPLGEKFDNTTAYLTFLRFWNKRVDIKTSLFGTYEVLYVRYPGLPPSPPSAFSDGGIIYGEPYHNNDNNGRTMKPLGVDVSKMGHEKGPNRSLIATIVLSASVAVILCCAVAWVLLLKNRDRVSQQEGTPPTTIPSFAKSSGAAGSIVGSGPSSASLSYGSSIAAYSGSAKTFSSNEIERATNNFNETRIVGEGGFGRVYSGVLDDGSKVAVKVLKRDDHQGGREFLAEVEMLSRLHHRNLVKLIGICIEDRTRCLVYELVPNGSVDSHLHGVDKERAPLNWSSRLKIALGSARGLAYLHEDSSPRVIHRDFKSSNILLEHDFMPKVSDFGLARTGLDEENKHISTRVMGTFGYVAPEYAMTGHLLVKSDVYSYGVVLLELLTGRKPVDMSQPPGQENLVSWARPLLTSEEGLALTVDKSLGPNFPSDSIAKVAAIASMCVEPEVSNRPFMGEVVQALKLVCNECEETKEMGSSSYSQDDLPINTDPLCNNSPISCYDYGLDLERGLSMSELLSSSVQYERPYYDSRRRHSSSGPLETKNTRHLWQKMRRLSRGSVSEHGVIFRLWPGSY